MAVASVVLSLGLISVSADFMNCIINPGIISLVQFKLLFGWTRISNISCCCSRWRSLNKWLDDHNIEWWTNWWSRFRLNLLGSIFTGLSLSNRTWMDGWLTKRDRVVAHTLQTTQPSHSCINGTGEWTEEWWLLWLCAVMNPSGIWQAAAAPVIVNGTNKQR